jgi:hypothetical protein
LFPPLPPPLASDAAPEEEEGNNSMYRPETGVVGLKSTEAACKLLLLLELPLPAFEGVLTPPGPIGRP